MNEQHIAEKNPDQENYEQKLAAWNAASDEETKIAQEIQGLAQKKYNSDEEKDAQIEGLKNLAAKLLEAVQKTSQAFEDCKTSIKL